MGERKRDPDFREFVFTATGVDTDVARLTPIDVHDNLLPELDRLEALAELLGGAREEVDPRILAGAGLLLRDIQRRMRAILSAAEVKK